MKPKWECHLRAFVLLWIFLGIPSNIKTTESSQNEDLHQHHISDFLAESTGARENLPCSKASEEPEEVKAVDEPARKVSESVAPGNAETPEIVENVHNVEKNHVEEIPAATEPVPVENNEDILLEKEIADGLGTSPPSLEEIPNEDVKDEVTSDVLAVDVQIDAVGSSNVTGIATEKISVNDSSTSHSEGADEIPSFSEWTQKVLAEAEKSGGTNHSVPTTTAKTVSSSKLRQKNYASPDCGAKLLSANPEAQHVSAVLNPARDEYLLSICSSKTWFVVELCEAIQAKRVEIANFELFSSSPKDFRVFISDRYPTREWALVGQFTATDERSIQSFSLQQQFFGKFVKVELDSHYGTRYYCPISLFRVYGTSEYEVLNIEDEHRSHFDATDEETLDDVKTADSQEPGNLFDSATKAVLDMVKKATGVFAKTGQPIEINSPSTTNQTRTNLGRCRSVRQTSLAQVSEGINSTLSCGWENLGQLTSLPWLQTSLAGLCLNKSANVTIYSKELELAEMIYGTALLAAVCHWAQIADISYQVAPPAVPCVANPVPVNPVNLSKVPESQGENAEVEDLPSMTPTASDLEVLEAWFPEVTDVVIPPSEMPAADTVPKYEAFQNNGASNATDPKLNAPASANNGLGSAQQKESVFVRLSNRIKALERNMSLSSQYLEELSRRYKRQVDDMQKNLNKTLLTLNETLLQMSLKEQQQQQEIRLLNSEIADLKMQFETVLQENLTLRAQMVEHHVFLMVVELILVAALFVFCARRHFRRWLDGQPHEQRSLVPVTLEIPSKVQQLTVPVTENLSGSSGQQVSPVPSVSGSTSSSWDSAFSYKVSGSNRSREPSPGSGPSLGKLKKKKKKRKNSVTLTNDEQFPRIPIHPIRLKSDNWQWHSRASTLASALIKENIEPPGMRGSF